MLLSLRGMWAFQAPMGYLGGGAGDSLHPTIHNFLNNSLFSYNTHDFWLVVVKEMVQLTEKKRRTYHNVVERTWLYSVGGH